MAAHSGKQVHIALRDIAIQRHAQVGAQGVICQFTWRSNSYHSAPESFSDRLAVRSRSQDADLRQVSAVPSNLSYGLVL